MTRVLTTVSLMLLAVGSLGAQTAKWIWQPRSEGPYYDYTIMSDDPKEYYDAGGPEKNMPGNEALTLLRLKPASAGTHITIVFDQIQIGEFDEMRIYEGLVTLNNYPDEDGEYLYDWPKGVTPISAFKGNPANSKISVSSSSSGGELCVAFRCNSSSPGWKGMIYCVKNGAPEPGTQPAVPANISFTVSDNLGTDEDGEAITETDITLSLGAEKDGTVIKIDWGSGPEDYTIGSVSAATITRSTDAGAEVKIFGELTLFDASGNRVITAFKPGENKKLTVLRLAQNKITNLDLMKFPALRDLSVTDNKLSMIDLSHLAELREFYGAWNPYTELRTAMNPQLTVLTCYNTGIRELNLSENTKLEVLKAGDNKYDQPIDLAANKALKSVDLENAGLENLDLSKHPKLTTILLSGNKLAALPLAEAGGLRSIDISRNRFDACALTDLFFTLPQLAESDAAMVKISANTGAAGSGTAWANKRGWKTDVVGDGEGCATVRLRFDQTEHGSFETRVAGEVLPQWSPISRGTRVQVVVKPDADYIADKILFNGKAITDASFEANDYGYISVSFVRANETARIPKGEIVLRREASIVVVSGLSAGERYEIFGLSGQIIASGTACTGGEVRIDLSEKRKPVIIRQGNHIFKLII